MRFHATFKPNILKTPPAKPSPLPRLSRPVLVVLSLLICALGAPVQAQLGPDPNAAIVSTNLRSQPPRDYDFNRASLRDVLRFLATDAGISYVSVAEVADEEEKLVTFSLRASPFRALEIIAKSNGIDVVYDDDVWYLRPLDKEELVARIYKLRYNTQEKVTSDSAASTAPGSQNGGLGGSQESSTGGGPDLGLSLSGVTNIFQTDPKQLIADITSLIGVPEPGLAASLGVSVDGAESNTTGRVGPSSAGEPGGPQVIWNSDSNTLYVVATRNQQGLVEGYLESMDRPQPLIAIEVKFIETNRNPREQLGVDWSGTLQEGFTAAARNITASPNGSLVFSSDTNDSLQTGNPAGEGANFDIRTNDRLRSISASAPYSAVLSASDVAITLRAFLDDRDSTQTAYPRVLTRNNREVVIRSVLNQPVLASSSAVTPGIGGTTTSSISYLPIGTIINVLPKEMEDGTVALNLSISISNIVNQVRIGQTQDLFPVASTRVFSAALSVTSGYTLAIGGLEEAQDIDSDNGVPFLKDIPILGYAFKSSDRTRANRNLLLLITPTLLPANGTDGMTAKPISTVPLPRDAPTPPAFTIDGTLVGGAPALGDAVRWLAYQSRYFDNLIAEARFLPTDLGRLRSLVTTSEMLILQIELMKDGNPDRDARLDIERDQVADLLERLESQAKRGRKIIVPI